MFGKKLYFFFFDLILLAGYIASYFFLKPLDSYKVISILFITLALVQLFFLPVFLPKHEKGYGGVRLGLFFSSLVYLVITVIAGYLFAFKHVLEGSMIPNTNISIDESFYFLIQAVFFTLYSSTIILTVSKPERYDDDDEEEEEVVEEKPKIEEKPKELTNETESNETQQ